MWLLLVGLGLFFVAHLVPTRPDLRARLVARFGAGRYSGLFSVVSLVALAMIVWGYGRMQGLARGNPQVWDPPAWSKHVTMLLMVPALILLVAAYVPSRIRNATGHPMLIAIMLWALGHLLANGDLASLLLFGSFLAYAVYDRISVGRRHALGPLGEAKGGLPGDVAAIAGGLVLYALLLFWGHQKLTGVPLLP
jgi:uncharacterized membrane protein